MPVSPGLDSWSLSGNAKADAAYLLRDCNGTHTHNTGNYPFDCNLLATGEDELYALYRRGICIQIHQKSKLAFTSQASFLLRMH